MQNRISHSWHRDICYRRRDGWQVKNIASYYGVSPGAICKILFQYGLTDQNLKDGSGKKEPEYWKHTSSELALPCSILKSKWKACSHGDRCYHRQKCQAYQKYLHRS